MILIYVTKEIDRFISKCLKYKINLHNVKREKNYILVDINEKDLKEIIRLNYYSDIKIVKYYGIKGFVKNIKKYFFDYLLLCISLLLLFFISNIVIDVDISHESREKREYLDNILKEKGIHAFSIAKSISELNEISNLIIKENKEQIDWISINRVGMKYVVSFEERIINTIPSKDNYCHVVAKKDGVVRRIVASSGVSLFEIGDFVKSGDILLSGQIMLGEKIKDNICASGEVLAETWYKVHIKIPLKYQKKVHTNKNRYNFVFNGNYFYKDNYPEYDEEVVFKFDFFKIHFKIVRQREFQLIDETRDKETAQKLALKESQEKLLDKIDRKSKILEQKVLKETTNNSTIELEIFIVAEEDIGVTKLFEAGEENDSR